MFLAGCLISHKIYQLYWLTINLNNLKLKFAFQEYKLKRIRLKFLTLKWIKNGILILIYSVRLTSIDESPTILV